MKKYREFEKHSKMKTFVYLHSVCGPLLKNLELLIRKINHLKEVPIVGHNMYTKWVLFVNKNFMPQPKPEYI